MANIVTPLVVSKVGTRVQNDTYRYLTHIYTSDYADEYFFQLLNDDYEQKRYKTISAEQIAKETTPKRKQALQQAFDYLDNRRLINAVNRPLDGWKFDFTHNNIELLYRVDKRQSAVYNTRHRPLKPFNGIKEWNNEGEKFALPYGIENNGRRSGSAEKPCGNGNISNKMN